MVSDTVIHEQQVTVYLSGELTVQDAGDLRKHLYDKIDAGFRSFIIDMNELHYIDSAGLGILVSVLKKTREKQGTILIRGAKDGVKKVFELTRLTAVFDFD
ncbi:STAS domain-containing protein [Salisediminibacterium halotolerans]|uniref:Anti-sigma factor antagonist n=1 Tax=Salisediminibacterium halotolerans TaxID=517425 RepID=A0A1H9VPZ8_9BACI|nr:MULTISPECIES: STAS domain-containing protein [Salisediminibacterium]RLJ75425.1 anti-sigma-factor antagonist [Actinophytocola xinjiangensis]RPE89278.1 anti-sigma-factor antagonist [Salisediminibacterium halotolerans]TWG36038.1 anti-sigma-factor antagonist [Salisediminibacterium halotolerans]SES23303.1 anti-sigma B factor antagonist [Salisediminibacterium haloalkalitolerans]GEL07495.1 hypothetical protein SHA02_09110 [Salisediminibacterium halotolerans]